VENKNWTEVISPKFNWFDFKLKEIWNYRDLLFIFVKRDIISVYKQTILGPLWFFIGPIFTVITFTFVFNRIAGISTDNIPAPLFYLAGTTLWNYFQSCFTATSTTFVSNAHIFGKVYFPRMIAPLSVILSNLFKFCIQLLMFLVFWGYYYWKGEVVANSFIVLLPILILLMAGTALGMGIIISALTTKYRDLSYFISFGVTLLMYATPVIYPISAIPAEYKAFVAYNPISPIIEAFRYAFTGYGSFQTTDLLYSLFIMLALLFSGIVLFNKVERNFMDTV
jgi:lipopolysaccharide transport system permease protein